MTTYIAICSIGDGLYHYGIKDMKWGYRRWQNYDGSLTEAGRLRYNKGSGKRKFAKDVLNDTSRSFGKEYIDKIKRWGKTAEELKIMDPNDPLSYFDLGGVREQNRILRDVYNSMPSVSEKQKKYYTDLGQKLTKNADGYRKEKIQHLDDVINEFDADLHKELNTKPGKDTRNYIMDAVKGYNETDFDMVVYQHMDEVLPVYGKGYIDTKTFSKLYDGQVAEDAVDFLGYGWDAEEITKWHDRFQTVKNQYPSQESRLADFFSQHPEIEVMEHNQYDKNELYHYGIKDMRWYKRRYQNEDGSLTPLGRVHYGVGAARKRNLEKKISRVASYHDSDKKELSGLYDELKKSNDEYKKLNEQSLKTESKMNELYTSMHDKQNKSSEDRKKAKEEYKDARSRLEYIQLDMDDEKYHSRVIDANIRELNESINNNKSLYNKMIEKYTKRYGTTEVEKLPKINNEKVEAYINDIPMQYTGVPGQRWGVRGYQNEDGSLTEAGKLRYNKSDEKRKLKDEKTLKSSFDKARKNYDKYEKADDQFRKAESKTQKAKTKYYSDKQSYDDTAKKLNKTQNGLGAKLIGVDKYKENKLSTQLKKQESKLIKSENAYNKAVDDLMDKSIKRDKLTRKYEKENDKAFEKARKYMEKYGTQSIEELLKSDSDFDQNVAILEYDGAHAIDDYSLLYRR